VQVNFKEGAGREAEERLKQANASHATEVRGLREQLQQATSRSSGAEAAATQRVHHLES